MAMLLQQRQHTTAAAPKSFALLVYIVRLARKFDPCHTTQRHHAATHTMPTLLVTMTHVCTVRYTHRDVWSCMVMQQQHQSGERDQRLLLLAAAGAGHINFLAKTHTTQRCDIEQRRSTRYTYYDVEQTVVQCNDDDSGKNPILAARNCG